MPNCVQCHSQPAEQCWSIPVFSLKIRQIFNICGGCASEAWDKYKNTPSIQSIIICIPKSPKEFENLAKENNSDRYGSSWCEFNISE